MGNYSMDGVVMCYNETNPSGGMIFLNNHV